MLAYGDEPLLDEAAEAVLESSGVDLDLVLVDNGCTDGRSREPQPPGVFASCVRREHSGLPAAATSGAPRRAASSSASSTATPSSYQTLAELVAAATADGRRGRGAQRAAGYERPEVMNSAGNPCTTPASLGRAGSGEPAGCTGRPATWRSVSGATMSRCGGRFEHAGRFQRADVRLLRGCRAQLARLAGRVAVRVRARGRESCTTTSSRATRARCSSSSGTDSSWCSRCTSGRPSACSRPALLVSRPRSSQWRSGRGGRVKGGRLAVAAEASCRGAVAAATVQASRSRVDAEMASLLTGDFYPGEETGLAVPRVFRKLTAAYWSVARRLL